MRYAISICFKGTAYKGWQKQENALTVQAEVERAFNLLTRTNTEITGCCRTDSGVHAKQLVAHFDVIEPLEADALYRLNAILPKDIVVTDLYSVSDTFHARFDATLREYTYHIHLNKNPFKEGLSWQRVNNIDFATMNVAAAMIVGEKEFRCFCKGDAPNDNYSCKVFTAHWEYNQEAAVFRISANRFLRNMVRAIVGTLMEVGLGKLSLDEFKAILENGTRSDAGSSVPAVGLYLERVVY